MKGIENLRKFLVEKHGFKFKKATTDSEYYSNPKFGKTIRISDHVGNTVNTKYLYIVKENSKFILFLDREVATYETYLELKKDLEIIFYMHERFPVHFEGQVKLMNKYREESIQYKVAYNELLDKVQSYQKLVRTNLDNVKDNYNKALNDIADRFLTAAGSIQDNVAKINTVLLTKAENLGKPIEVEESEELILDLSEYKNLTGKINV